MPTPPPRDAGADPAPDPDDDLAAREQAALRRLAGVVAAGAQPAEVFAAVAYEVARVTGMALVQIQRYGPDDTMTVAGSWGAAPHPFQPGTTWDIEVSLIAAQIKRTRRLVRVDDFGVGTGPIVAGVLETGIRGGAGAPIVVDGELWGAMAAGPAKGAPVPPGLEDRLPEHVEATAYFVVAEALTNVAKHAGAQRAAVSASVEGGALRLAVSDDGAGGARVEGGGLIGLRDRLATLDGTLAVDSPRGRGTVVSATIPLAVPA